MTCTTRVSMRSAASPVSVRLGCTSGTTRRKRERQGAARHPTKARLGLAALREACELDLVDVHPHLHRLDRSDRHPATAGGRVLARADIDEEHRAVDRAAHGFTVELGLRRLDLRISTLDPRRRDLGRLLARHTLDLRHHLSRTALHERLEPGLLIDELGHGHGAFGFGQTELGLRPSVIEFPEDIASLDRIALRDGDTTDHAGIGRIHIGHAAERFNEARRRDAAFEGTWSRRHGYRHVERSEFHLLHGGDGGDEAGNGQHRQDDRAQVHACSFVGTSVRVTRPSSMWTIRLANR